MKTPRLAPGLVALLLIGTILPCFSQNRPAVNSRTQLPAGTISTGAPAATGAAEMLSLNYQITLSGSSNEESIGEISLVTCDPQISVSGPLSSSSTPTSFTVSGTLTEAEEGLILRYNIDYSFAVTTSSFTQGTDGPTTRSIDYQRHSSRGMLRMKVGTAYEVLKSGGVTYTITIAIPPKE